MAVSHRFYCNSIRPVFLASKRNVKTDEEENILNFTLKIFVYLCVNVRQTNIDCVQLRKKQFRKKSHLSLVY